MSYSLNSLEGVIQGVILGTTMGLIEGDTAHVASALFSTVFLKDTTEKELASNLSPYPFGSRSPEFCL